MPELDVDGQVGLQVCDGASSLELELLGPFDDTSRGDWWHAVVIAAADGVVWRGPRRNCPEEQVLGFVEALLHGGVETLARPYRRLG